MSKFASYIVAFVILTGSALANDTMDAMIGKTVTYTYPDGTVVKAEYSTDGTYSTDTVGSGTWKMNGDELCIETEGGDSGCTTLEPGKGSGDSWQAKDAFGKDVTISIE